MTTTVKVLIPAKEAEATQTTQYTAVNCKAIIDNFTVTNNGTANETISINIIPSAGVAGDSNLIVKQRAIAPNETYTFTSLIGHYMESGSSISTLASNANVLTIMCSGREIT